MHKLVESYYNAKTDKEKGEIMCEMTRQYVEGNISKEEIDDEILEQCHAIYYDDYFDDDKGMCEMAGLSEEEYLQQLDEETNHNLKPEVGDVVRFDNWFNYKDKTMSRLVNTCHCFLVVEKNDDMLKVYAMTSQVDKINKRPNDYIEVQSGTRRALVELNAFGENRQTKVRKIIAKLSDEDFERVVNAIKEYKGERTTVLESMNIIEIIRYYGGKDAYEIGEDEYGVE